MRSSWPAPHRCSALLALPLLLGCATAAAARGGAARGAMTLEVDLAEAPRRLFHARLTLPAAPGPLVLVYPKWIPGEHGPTGPLADLVGLRVRAGGAELRWRRDEVDQYALRVEVPAGAQELALAYDFISPPPASLGFSDGASASANLVTFNWNQVVLYPAGAAAREVRVRPAVRLPAGWAHASSLRAAGREGARVAFEEVSLEELVDSPVLAGRYLEETPLGAIDGAPVSIAVAAESAAQARLTEEQKGWLKNLVAEEAALFGARHFDRYVFLLALSDAVTHFGLEHHQSSDDRLGERTLLDRDRAVYDLVPLLAHEWVHSWNGKHRRPAGLATPDFQAPMKGGLLWIYEGLTQYLGRILVARAGAFTPEQAREDLAMTVQRMRDRRGRAWRPLEDTAAAAQILYPSRDDWAGLRRAADFYDEGHLLWLEVDCRIREATQGKASLDDFARRFFGGKSGGPSVVPYALEDVVKALSEVAPSVDFRALFSERLQALAAEPPLKGVEASGWRLAWAAEPGELFKASEKVDERLDLRPSLGLLVDPEKKKVKDVIPGSPADRAGLAPGMVLVGVDGKKVTADRLLQAVAAPENGTITLLVENAEALETHALQWAGGARYPRLERLEGRPDVYGAIGRPRAR